MNNRRSTPLDCFDRRYLKELLPAFAVMAIAILLLAMLPRTPGRRLLLLGVGAVALAWTSVVTIAAIRRLDELQQRIHLIAIAISFTLTGVLLGSMEFLHAVGLAWSPSGTHWWMFMMLTWSAGVAILNRHYR